MRRMLLVVSLVLVCGAAGAMAAGNADFDGDGMVGFSDFLAFAGAFGSAEAKYDLDDSGTVGFSDFLAFVRDFGKKFGGASDPLTATANVCRQCHVSDGRTFMDGGADVSPPATWRATMMAYATTDPYWRAKMSGEVAARPAIQAVIERECTTCHASLGSVEASAKGVGYTRADLETDAKGQDGVSCLVCHKIQDVNLGSRAGMSGHYTVTNATEVYGPYPDPFGTPMQMQTGFAPVHSAHIAESGLCASCHNLYTPVLDEALNVISEFPEQVPFSEWVVSDYAVSGKTCQSCHMDEVGIQTRISTRPPSVSMRTPVWDHRIVGGNTFMLNLMKENRVSLGIDGSAADFDAAIQKTRDMLTQNTLDLTLSHETVGDSLDVNVILVNKAGHKFPSGYPERRAWIHVRMADDSGQIFFESGAVDDLGQIIPQSKMPYIPHLDVVRNPEDIQIYEVVPVDPEGETTRRLLSVARAVKDNRLLPRGFDPGRHLLGEDVPVVGAAASDSDFDADRGGDTVTYRVKRPGGTGVTVEARVYYQSVPPDAIEDLRAFDTPDAKAFVQMVDALPDRKPEEIASQNLVIPQ